MGKRLFWAGYLIQKGVDTVKLLIKNVRAVDNGLDEITDILIDNGKITRMGTDIVEICDGREDRVIDATGLTAMPGLFDMHVHFRDPGQTHKEDIRSGCQAALAGGVTGVLTMPNTKPPIDSPELVQYELNKAKNTGVTLYPVACITKGMDGGALTDFAALRSAGAAALSDDGRPVKNAELMRQAIEKASKLGMLVCSHCEDLDIINGGIMHKGSVSEELGVKGMDRASEDYITAREIVLASAVGGRVHICHVSTKGCVDIIREAKRLGVQVTCETAPHYFMLTHEKLRSRDANDRMNPPLREESDRAAIESAVLDGTIDCIVTDHAPHSPQEKMNFELAPNGIVGLETSLAATLTALFHTGKMSLQDVVQRMSIRPREILGITPETLKVGAPANLILVDTERKWTVEPEKLHSKSHNTAFRGMELTGKVKITITDGRIRFEES
ncbi:MAG: dihydroorotase [Oscillospiraceae bacterium]|nr:dihydroorotase [Oscillospiraceae bacterium]